MTDEQDAAAAELAQFHEIDAAIEAIYRAHAQPNEEGYLTDDDPWVRVAWHEVMTKVASRLPPGVWAAFERWRDDEIEHAELIDEDPANRVKEVEWAKLAVKAMKVGGHETLGDLMRAVDGSGSPADLREYIRVHGGATP